MDEQGKSDEAFAPRPIDRPALGYESMYQPPKVRPRWTDAEFHRVVGGVVIVLVGVPLGVGCLIIGTAYCAFVIGGGVSPASTLMFTVGSVVILIGLVFFGVGFHQLLHLFRK